VTNVLTSVRYKVLITGD